MIFIIVSYVNMVNVFKSGPLLSIGCQNQSAANQQRHMVNPLIAFHRQTFFLMKIGCKMDEFLCWFLDWSSVNQNGLHYPFGMGCGLDTLCYFVSVDQSIWRERTYHSFGNGSSFVLQTECFSQCISLWRWVRQLVS